MEDWNDVIKIAHPWQMGYFYSWRGRSRSLSGTTSRSERIKKDLSAKTSVLCCVLAGTTRLELATSDVTGRRSNQTELRPRIKNCTMMMARVRGEQAAAMASTSRSKVTGS